MVPLSIEYLGNEKYGLWLTIFSFIGWFNFFDFGIGHGLRNRLTEAWAMKKVDLAKTYVSTAYFSIMIVIVMFLIILSICFPLISWESIFKTEVDSIRRVVFIAYLLFFSNMLLSLVNVIFLADQRSSFPGLIQFISQLITLFGIYVLLSFNNGSIFYYAIMVMGSQSLIFLIATFIALKYRYPDVRPELKYFDKKTLKDLFEVSGRFFFIQIAGSLLFATDNFIINYYLGAEKVTIYNVAFKYFMLPIVVVNIIAGPYWSAFTDAYAKEKEDWIKSSLKNLLRISAMASVLTILMILFADIFYSMWVGDSVSVPFRVSLLIGINTIIMIMIEPLFMLINGTGKLRIQMYTTLISAFVNIPLSIFLGNTLNLGVSGVVLSSLICSLIGVLVYPLQVKRLLNKSATGIWNS